MLENKDMYVTAQDILKTSDIDQSIFFYHQADIPR